MGGHCVVPWVRIAVSGRGCPIRMSRFQDIEFPNAEFGRDSASRRCRSRRPDRLLPRSNEARRAGVWGGEESYRVAVLPTRRLLLPGVRTAPAAAVPFSIMQSPPACMLCVLGTTACRPHCYLPRLCSSIDSPQRIEFCSCSSR